MEKGSRVRFLNRTGGGTVSSVKGGRCTVVDEDGWEWTLRTSEVVEIRIGIEKEIQSLEQSIGRVRMEDGRPVKRSGPQEGCREIDLHGESLCRGVSDPVAIHVRQLEKIKSTLDREKGHHGARIVFIHGKGDGTLRKELISELSSRKAWCDYEDAPFDRYGYHGATKVTMK